MKARFDLLENEHDLYEAGLDEAADKLTAPECAKL
jgi:hypothetical protein